MIHLTAEFFSAVFLCPFSAETFLLYVFPTANKHAKAILEFG